MREIVLDTETTGLNPGAGDRLVEIGCVELNNRGLTGATFHRYLNPQRPMPEAAARIHGLSDDFLADKPLFADIAEELLRFLGDATLVIHNAPFDMGFLNAELARIGRRPLMMERVTDTLEMARMRFPGAPASLDALCKRFNVDNSGREFHGALLDAELLADVYLELTGGRQQGLELSHANLQQPTAAATVKIRPPRPHAATAEELQAHAAFLDKLTDPLWRKSGVG